MVVKINQNMYLTMNNLKRFGQMIATYQFIPNINMPDFKSIQVQPNTSLYINKLIEVQGNIDKSVLPDIEKGSK